jgi:hypothetical protein
VPIRAAAGAGSVVDDMPRKFGSKLFAIEYQHADGYYYRHDSRDKNVDVIAEDDGSVRLRRRGGPLVGQYRDGDRVKTFFENPPKRGRGNPAGEKQYVLRVGASSRSVIVRASGLSEAVRKAIASTGAAKNAVVNVVAIGPPTPGTKHNPRGGKMAQKKTRRRRSASKVVGRARRRPVAKRKAARRKTTGVPAWIRAKGFSSYAAYMASIRPGGNVATKRRKSRKRSSGARRSPSRRRRSYRRNPSGLSLGSVFNPKTIMSQVIDGAKDAGIGVAGMAAARLVRGKLNIDGNTPKGAIVELGFGILGAPLVAKFAGRDAARAFVQGVFMGPAITAVKSMHVPVIAPALGDEGELPLFGGSYDLGGTYDLDAIGAGGGAAIGAGNGRVGDVDDLGGEEGYM